MITLRGGEDVTAFNPLHFGGGAGFSDAFLFLTLPVLAVIALSLALPKAQAATESVPAGVSGTPEPQFVPNWVPSCSVPWMPACQEAMANGSGGDCVEVVATSRTSAVE